MVVYFLRHASAGEPLSDARKDENRALDKDGIEQCGYVGRAMAALEVELDAILTSPLKRAAQTAALVGKEMGYQGEPVIDDALRPEAGFGAFRSLLDRFDGRKSIMVVGHNPNLSEFLGRAISGVRTGAGVELKKGAVAKVEMSGTMGTLHWCITPRMLRRLHATATESSRPKTSRK